MPDIDGLMADPDFQALPEERQQAILEKVGAQRGKAFGIPETMRPRGPNEERANPLGATALDAAALGVAAPAGAYGASRLLPFLLRLGTTAPAVGAAAIPAAAKTAQQAEEAAPAIQAEAASAGPQIALRLKQMAEQSGVNKQAIMEAIKDVDPRQFGFETLKDLKDFIFTARTRL